MSSLSFFCLFFIGLFLEVEIFFPQHFYGRKRKSKVLREELSPKIIFSGLLFSHQGYAYYFLFGCFLGCEVYHKRFIYVWFKFFVKFGWEVHGEAFVTILFFLNVSSSNGLEIQPTLLISNSFLHAFLIVRLT